jgi:transposase
MKIKEYYIGLDAHKESVAISYALGGSREAAVYHGTCGGSLLAVETALRKLAKKLEVPFRELKVCYEAGPTGFVLARRLRQLKLECVVMAPTKSTRKPGEKVKTDIKDASKIAREFRNGDVVEVRVPPATDEAVRDVSRARTDAVDDCSRSKQRLKSFLLRSGHRYEGKANWSGGHMNYLRSLSLADPAQSIVLEEYLSAIDTNVERVQRLTDKLKELLEDWEWKDIVKALMAFRGFKEVAAMTLVAELGDLRRFKNPRQLMAFLGLVPSEDSSGGRRRQGSITRCGNSHARWMLIESAKHYRLKPKVAPTLSARQDGQGKEVKALSWRAQNRLHDKHRRLTARRLNANKITVAVARELSGFLWELQNKCGLAIPGGNEGSGGEPKLEGKGKEKAMD